MKMKRLNRIRTCSKIDQVGLDYPVDCSLSLLIVMFLALPYSTSLYLSDTICFGLSLLAMMTCDPTVYNSLCPSLSLSAAPSFLA